MAKTKRQAVSKKTRFEVFKRDSFACQYCGKSAPDTILHIDHINPVSKGGDNDILNLITSCQECNLGKGARELDDDSVVAKQRAQLAELAERKEQLEMMLHWRDGLKEIEATQVDVAVEAFEKQIDDEWELNQKGRTDLKRLINKFGLQEVLDCIEIAIDSYYQPGDDDSIELIFRRIGGIAANRARKDSHLYYIRGIVRNRMYCNETYCLELLQIADARGVSEDELKVIAIKARNWTEWQASMEELISVLEGRNNG